MARFRGQARTRDVTSLPMFANFAQYEYYLAQIQLALFMLGMGATLTPDDFKPVFQQPRDLGYGLAMQLVGMPFLALLIILLFDPPDGIAVGLLLVAALPGGTMSNIFAYVARANMPLKIALSACSTLLSLATIPLMLRLLAYQYVPPEFRMPVWEIVREIVVCMLIPLAAGMLVVRFLPHYQKPVSKWAIRAGFVFVAVIVIGSLGSGRIDPWRLGWQVPLAIIVFCVASQQLNMLPYRLLRAPAETYAALGIEVTMRNINVALLLWAVMFPGEASLGEIGQDVLFVLLFYAAVAFFAGTPLALRMRRVIKRQRAMKVAEV